eukprot:m51a1_g3153 putative phosphoserine phosphatase (225) ;mRNA; r:335990-336930
MSKKIKLVAFDVDGTLTLDNFWILAHETFGTKQQAAENKRRFFAGEIDYVQWAHSDVNCWAGHTFDDVLALARQTRLMAGLTDVARAIREAGADIILLSSGVDVMANTAGTAMGVTRVYTNDLLHDGGVLTGKCNMRVLFHNKDAVLRDIAAQDGAALDEVCFVGDGRNDIPAFRESGLAIAINPADNDVAAAAHHVVRNSTDLRDILPYLLPRLVGSTPSSSH